MKRPGQIVRLRDRCKCTERAAAIRGCSFAGSVGVADALRSIVVIGDVEIVNHRDRAIPADAVVELNRAVGWWPERTPESVQAALTGSIAVGAWVSGQLVGFARAITDGPLRAYVEDVMVHPDWRRQGVATATLERLIELLADVDVVSLFTAAALVPLYDRAGFAATHQVVMHRRPVG
jgi:GNAT superfamily N-acetyltransferase